MSSWFKLELDTTSPKLEIIAPQYTSSDIGLDIRIESNEVLLNYQEIYIIDSSNIRHDIILSFNNTNLQGVVMLNGISTGIATIYCRLKDEVGNVSDLVAKSINIMEGNVLQITLQEKYNNIILDKKESKVDLYTIHNQCEITCLSQEVISIILQRNVQLKINK